MMKIDLKKTIALFLLTTCAFVYACKHENQVIPAADAVTETKAPALKTTANQTILVPVGTITDHSDPTIPNSLAWYMQTYGPGTAGNENVFTLSSAAVYNCKKSLTVQPYCRITEASGVDAVLQCDPTGFTWGAYHEFVKLSSNAILLHVELRLNWMPERGVYANTANNIQIIDVTIHKSKKVPDTVGKSYLIFLENCIYANIDHCLLRRAGCDSDEENFQRWGWGIRLLGGHDFTVTYNDLAVVPSSGIFIENNYNLTINNNTIYDTGRALVAGYVADGITGYHNATQFANRNLVIHYNSITKSRNHGLHVSGKGISIEHNTFNTIAQSNIYVGDQKTPQECCENVWISYNSFGTFNGAYSMNFKPVVQGTVHLTGNTGTQTTYYTYCN